MKDVMQGEMKFMNAFQWLVLRLFLLATMVLFAAKPLCAETIDGFITKIDSPTAFDIGSLHILVNPQTRCSTATLSTPKVKYSYGSNRFYNFWHSMQKKSAQCSTLKLSIGSKIYVIGALARDRRFSVNQLIAYKYVYAPGEKLLGAAILEEEPMVQHKAGNWNGTLWVDGYPVAITSAEMLAAQKYTNIRYAWPWRTSNLYTVPPEFSENDTHVPSLRLLQENSCVVYNLAYKQDGNLAATALRIWPNYLDAKEKMFLVDAFKARIVDPDYKQHISGSIHFSRHLSYKEYIIGDIHIDRHLFGRSGQTLAILPDQTVQNWVSNLGMELVPQYQKQLPDTSATKIHFKFYVVSPLGNSLNQYLRVFDGIEFINHDGAAFIAMPNGVILVPDNVLGNLHNKSQLVANLEYAISSVLQKQLYTQWVATTTENPYVLYPFVAYRREQALRIGIRQMYLAGYDIREAPFAWAVAQGKPVNNPIINSKHPDQEIPWYAAYAFNYISHYYQDVDYSKLKRGEREYQQFLQELYKADPSLPRPASSPTQIPPQAH
jgi:hypothetical protein